MSTTCQSEFEVGSPLGNDLLTICASNVSSLDFRRKHLRILLAYIELMWAQWSGLSGTFPSTAWSGLRSHCRSTSPLSQPLLSGASS